MLIDTKYIQTRWTFNIDKVEIDYEKYKNKYLIMRFLFFKALNLPRLCLFIYSTLSQSVLDLKIKSTIKFKTIRLNFDLVAKIFYLLLCWKFIQRGNRYDKHFRWTLPFYLGSSKLWVWSYGNMPTSVSRGELPRRERPGLRKLKYIPILYIAFQGGLSMNIEYWRKILCGVILLLNHYVNVSDLSTYDV